MPRILIGPVTSTIVRDNSTDGGNTTGTSLTFSHINGVGGTSPTILWVTARTAGTITGITYNGVAMTSAVSLSQISLWYLINPAAGSNNVVISTSGSTTIYGMSASYQLASTTGVPDGTKSAQNNGIGSGAANGTSVTTTANKCFGILACYHTGPNAPSAGSGSVVLQTNSNISMFDSGSSITPARNYAMSALAVDGIQNWTHVMVTFPPLITNVSRTQAGTRTVAGTRTLVPHE